jgi:hypothetical protein
MGINGRLTTSQSNWLACNRGSTRFGYGTETYWPRSSVAPAGPGGGPARRGYRSVMPPANSPSSPAEYGSVAYGSPVAQLARLADVLGIDLVEAAQTKLADSARRYPVERTRGSAAKAPHERAPAPPVQ